MVRLAAFLVLATFVEMARACTVIGVTHKATVDGSSLLAHTDDAGGGAADTRLIRVPAADHEPGSKRAVYNFFGGYPRITTKDRGSLYTPIGNQTLSTPLGYIPQVPHTFGYFDQDYGMMNEMQLSIAESTCTAKTVGWAKDVPHGYNLFGIAELTKIALERCDSARCAVQTMGDLAVEYGFYSEDSGDPRKPGYMDSAEALAISDKHGEMWVFHVMTGPKNSSAVWAAQRVPDGHVTAIANAFLIREIDLIDKDKFMASSNVISFAEEMGWYERGTPFDFAKAYAWDDLSVAPGKILPLYAGRRLWRIFDTFAPSLHLDPRLGFQVNFTTYPFSVPVDKPVNLAQVINLLGDHYEGTEYDMTEGTGAGPFHAPIRYDGPFFDVQGGWERPIAMFRTMFSFILQIQPPALNLPNHLGGTAWYAQDSPHGSVFIPFSCAQAALPQSYTVGNQSVFNTDSAWWAFNFVNQWSMIRWNVINAEVRSVMNETQAKAIALHTSWLENKLDVDQLQNATNSLASDIVSSWWRMAWSLVGKYSCGYIVTGEAPGQMKVPGYSHEWLVKTEFAGWPGTTYLDPMAPERALRPPTDNHISKLNAVEIIGFMVLGALLAIGTHHVVQTHRREGADLVNHLGMWQRLATSLAILLVTDVIAKEAAPLFPASHENITYLTDDNFNELVLDSHTPWLVNFYNPMCWHCKNFAPVYENIAAHYKARPLPIHVGAINCLDHVLCRKLEINGYPHVVFYNFDPNHYGENQRRLGDNTGEAIYSIVQSLEAKYSNVENVATETSLPETTLRPIWTATPEISNNSTRLLDAGQSIIYGLKHEIFVGTSSLSHEALGALKQWLSMLSSNFPGAENRLALQKLYHQVNDIEELLLEQWQLIVQEWQESIIEPSFQVAEDLPLPSTLFGRDGIDYLVCEGYTCGLWTLIHIVAQQATHTTDCVEMYRTIHNFINHFMSCLPCRDHFLAANPAQLQTKSSLSLQLWAHSAHNAVNERVRHPIFPSQNVCPTCQRDQGALQRYLNHYYGYNEPHPISLTSGYKMPIPWCLVIISGILFLLYQKQARQYSKIAPPLDKDHVVKLSYHARGESQCNTGHVPVHRSSSVSGSSPATIVS